MTPLDWIIIALYFSALGGVVWWSSRRQQTSADYFLAGRNVGFFAIGASLFASNIGSEHIVGLAGSGATGARGWVWGRKSEPPMPDSRPCPLRRGFKNVGHGNRADSIHETRLLIPGP